MEAQKNVLKYLLYLYIDTVFFSFTSINKGFEKINHSYTHKHLKKTQLSRCLKYYVQFNCIDLSYISCAFSYGVC